MYNYLQGLLRAPIQAPMIYNTAGAPRQRHVFIVRFIPNGANTKLGNLTFAIKRTDRPKVSPKVEELNQYNKRRQVYTGFKIDPLRMTFYDSANGAAQNMWTEYSRYYFGDFRVGAQAGYAYDVTTTNFVSKTGYGFAPTSSGSSGGTEDFNGQFFFNKIEIYQFYENGRSHVFDCYTLTNPRITSYDPDELDYQSSEVATIQMQIAYENLQYAPQQPVRDGSFEEFTNGDFFGNPILVPQTGANDFNSSPFNLRSPINPSVGSLFSSANGNPGPYSDYRYRDSQSTGSLGSFGNFIFGNQNTPNAVTRLGNELGGFNSRLADTLMPNRANDPMAAQWLNGVGTRRGIDGAYFDTVRSNALGAQMSPFGGMGNQMTTGMLASRSNAVFEGAMVLDPSAYGAMNANSTGTAQYGYNPPNSSGLNDPGDGGGTWD